MNKLFATLLTGAMLLPVTASAALDETLRIKETIEIDAPADVVWAKVGNFNDMSWHPAITKTELTGGNNNEVGATRKLTLQDGGAVNEVLTAWDKDGKTLKYDITESVLPVREYSATLLVQPNGDKTTVTWRSMFKRKDPANPGAPGQDDKAAKEAITGIFKSGLENMKKLIEQK
jgi:mxaD protein